MMAMTAMDRKFGMISIVCSTLASRFMYSSLKTMASSTDREVLITRKATLYSTVLRVMRQASVVVNRNLKLLSPTHSLCRNPLAALKFWKASTVPNMGA